MISGFISFVFGLIFYFAPTVVAYFRNAVSAKFVVINILVGWTGIGWLACLIWGFIREKN